jgi:hypothetical protein
LKKLSPEIDRLMWGVAENPSAQALDEFGERYPEYRGELLRRVEMVRGLRYEAKGPKIKIREIPKFEPKPVATQSIPRGATVAAGLAFAALAFAGFTIFNSRHAVNPPPPVQVNEEPLHAPPVVYTNPSPPPLTIESPPKVENRSMIENRPAPTEAPSGSDNDRKKDMTLKDVDLVAALHLITDGTNLKLEIGPGFVNQKVTLAFHNKTAEAMLFQMAKDYAFTISDEGDNRLLVLPTPDGNSTDPSAVPNSRKIGP